MLRSLMQLASSQIRKVKIRTSDPSVDFEKSAANKIKFTDQELANMTSKMPGKKKSIVKTFQQKYQRTEEAKILKESKKSSPKEDNTEQEDPEQNISSMQMKTRRDVRAKFRSFRIYSIRRRVKAEDVNSLMEKSRVRLGQQYLPEEYMRRVQKIFHKYDQATLRDIADHYHTIARMRYSQEKVNYEAYPDLKFGRLELELPKSKQVQQIYLIGKPALFVARDTTTTRRTDDDPIDPEISYTQNVVVSYLLHRVPRTYATAFRLLTELKQKFPELKPRSFLDFGAGLSSGSVAFTEVFESTDSIFSVEPAGKMRKLGKYLTAASRIQHYESLGQLSARIRQVDVVYVGYVLNELRPELVEVYLDSLLAKVNLNGHLILVEYGNPYGSRLIHECRKWAIQKKMHIVAPCPHSLKCPLAREKHWCHFDQPSGMFPSEVFGKLPTDNSVKLEKYSYLILQKIVEPPQPIYREEQDEDATEASQGKTRAFYESVREEEVKIAKDASCEWDRVLFPLIKRGKHFLTTLCTRTGRFQKRVVSKSHGLEYKEGRKLKWGDYWRFGKRIPNRYRKERKTGKRLW